MPDLRLLMMLHLLWTAVLGGLVLLLSMRYPYPETATWFRVSLSLVATTGLSTLLLLTGNRTWFWVPPTTFGAASLGLVIYGVQVIRAYLRRQVQGRKE